MGGCANERCSGWLVGTNKFVLLRSHGIELDSGVKIVVKERSLRYYCSKDYNLNPGLVRPRRILLTDVEYSGGSRRLCRNKDVELPVVRLKQEPMQIIKQAIQSYKRTLCWNISSDLHFQWLWPGTSLFACLSDNLHGLC